MLASGESLESARPLDGGFVGGEYWPRRLGLLECEETAVMKRRTVEGRLALAEG